MPNPNPSLTPIDLDSPEGLNEHFGAIRDQLRSTAPEDIRLQLPNLVETIQDRSPQSEIVRFLIGVSFTPEYFPFDYRLECYRVPGADSDPVETIKDPVSDSHGYLTVVYPPDPEFDGQALRTVLLAAVERNLHTLETDPSMPGRESRLAELWGKL